MNKNQISIIAILVVVAIALGWTVYVKNAEPGDANPTVALNPGARAPAPVPTAPSASTQNVAPEKPAFVVKLEKLSTLEKEKMLLGMSVSSTSTDDQKNEFFFLANTLAKQAPAVEISDCKANPLVLDTDKASFLMKNSGPAEVQVIFSADEIFKIPAGKSVEIKNVLSHGVGFYGYGCSSSPGPVGLIYLSFLPQ